jgi:uncharacterized protein YodC (DUF2158 family)
MLKQSIAAIGLSIAMASGIDLSLTSAALASTADAANQSQAASFNTGDLVRLRSGSPLMTVQSVQADQVNCVWMQDGVVVSGTVPSVVLQAFPRRM